MSWTRITDGYVICRKGKSYWYLAECDGCGRRKLRSTTNNSNGCKPCQLKGNGHNKKHGHSHVAPGKRSPEYHSWRSARARCSYKNHPNWKHYGGRGIKMCKRWDRFDNFLADMGKRPKNKTLDRINPNGDYTPSNCRWATKKQQSNNRRKPNAN